VPRQPGDPWTSGTCHKGTPPRPARRLFDEVSGLGRNKRLNGKQKSANFLISFIMGPIPSLLKRFG